LYDVKPALLPVPPLPLLPPPPVRASSFSFTASA
jgi:hypothetical protein